MAQMSSPKENAESKLHISQLTQNENDHSTSDYRRRNIHKKITAHKNYKKLGGDIKLIKVSACKILKC